MEGNHHSSTFEHQAAAVASTHTEHHLAAQDPETETAVPVKGEATAHLMGLLAPKKDFYLFPNPDMSAAVAAADAGPMGMAIAAILETEADTEEMAAEILQSLQKTTDIQAPMDLVAAVAVAVLI